MKSRIWTIVCVALVLLLGLAACQQAAPTSKPGAFEWPKEYRVAASAIGSASHAMWGGLAAVVEKNTGMKVRVTPEDSIPLKQRWVAAGTYDLTPQSLGAVAQSGIEIPNNESSRQYVTKDGGPFQARIVYYELSQVFGAFVPGNSDIKTLYDIKGKRAALWTGAGDNIFNASLAWGKLTKADVQVIPAGSYIAQMRLVIEGKADVAFCALPAASTMVEAEAIPGGVRWLDYNGEKDPEGQKRFNEFLPAHGTMQITSGVASAIGHWGWGSAGLSFTRAQADAELNYRMVKLLDERYDEFKGLHPDLKDMTLEHLFGVAKMTYLPFHDGVVRYFKEKKMWDDDLEFRQQWNVKLVNRYNEAWQDALKQAEAKNITVDPNSNAFMDIWTALKKDRNIPIFKVRSVADMKALG